METVTAQGLNEWQKKVTQVLENGSNVLVVAPTGSGKSHLAMSVALTSARTLWVLPTKALTREWFMRSLESAAGPMRLPNIYTGDYRRDTPFYEGDLVFATYESALTQLRRKDPWFSALELLIFDEFQFVGEEERGGVVEELLILLSELKPTTTLLALSATIGNPETLASWLSRLFARPAQLVEIPYIERPVKLTQRAVKLRGEQEKRRYLYELIRSSPSEQFLVFTPRRFDAENLAKQFRNGGILTAAHHAGLDRLSRVTAEDSFRRGKIQILFCTATLQYGVNLPAHTVVVYDPVWSAASREFYLSTNDYLQMAGRAGRPIKSPVTGEVIVSGHVFVLSTDNYEHNYAKAHLINQQPEPLESSFETELVQRIHGLLLYKSATEIRKLLSKSFARVQNKQISAAIRLLEEMRFVKSGWLTPLGSFVAELNLSPFIASRFLRLLESRFTERSVGKAAAQQAFEEALRETSSIPSNLSRYQDLLNWVFVERRHLDGQLLMVNYTCPPILRDRVAWYLYAFERLSGFVGANMAAQAIATERVSLEGLDQVVRPTERIRKLTSGGKRVYIEVAIKDYDKAANVGVADWLGFRVHVVGVPRGWSDVVEILDYNGPNINAKPAATPHFLSSAEEGNSLTE